MTTSRLPTLSAVLLCTALVHGCGGDDDMPGTDAGPPMDAPVDSGPPEAPSLTFHVQTIVDDVASDAAGASFALESPGGMRAEGVTGPDGRVTFDDVDFEGGAVAALAYLEDYRLGGLANIEETEDELRIPLIPVLYEAPATATLSGVAANMVSATNILSVASSFGAYGEGAGARWSVRVPVGEEVTLVASEGQVVPSTLGRGMGATFDGWTRVDVPAVTEHTTVDLDFADAVTPRTASAAIPMPTSARSGSWMSDPDINILVRDFGQGSMIIGTQTDLRSSADGSRLEFDLEYARLDDAVDPGVQFVLFRSPAQSVTRLPGWPADGEMDVTFLDPPTVVEPEFGVDAAWGAPLRWDTVDIAVPAVLSIADSEDAPAITVVVLPGATSAFLPALPPGITAEELFRGAAADVTLYLCDGDWLDGCDRWAKGRSFGVTP